MFWVMVIIAASFIVIAIAMVAIAVFVSRAVKSVNRMEAEAGTAPRTRHCDERTGQANRGAGKTDCRTVHCGF